MRGGGGGGGLINQGTTLHEGVPVLRAAGKLRSANESESLAYSILNNIPVFPEAVTLGQQKYIRMMDEEASPKKGQKREAQAEDAARSSASASGSAVAVPMTPGGIVGDDEVMLALVAMKTIGESLRVMQFVFTTRGDSMTSIRCMTEMFRKDSEEDA